MNANRIQINGMLYYSEEIQEKLKIENLPEWQRGIYEFILNWFDSSDFILQKTSGSTGVPKEIKLKKSAMVASAKKTIQFFKLKENDTAWLCLPTEYIAGKMMIVRAIVGHLNLLISEPSGTPLIPKQPIEFTAMVPLQAQKLLESGSNFNSLKKLILGGAVSSSNLIEKLQNISTEVHATYGMTETCSHIALQRLNGANPDRYFKILNGVSISTNSNNCLVIHAPELLETSIETNDIVELISPTEFLVKGRIDNVINTGGIKVSPEEMENRITQLINRECIIVPERDTLLGHCLVLIVEGNYTEELASVLLEKIKFGIGRHKSPKKIRFIEVFPRTSSLKIDRKKVLEQLNTNL